MNRHAQQNTRSQAATYWTVKPLTELELPASRIAVIAPEVPVPVEGYFSLQAVMRTGVTVSIPLSKGMIKNDKLLFALSSDGTLFYTIFHIINIDDYNSAVQLHIPGEAFTWTGGRTVHFAYNIQRGDSVIMVSSPVAVPVRT